MISPIRSSGNRVSPARTALILSGGGAAGAYEVGVMKALFEGRSPSTGFTRLDPGILTGTSIGAINTAFLLSSPAPDLASATKHLEHIYKKDIAASAITGTSGLIRIRANPIPLLDPSNYPDRNPWPGFLRDVVSLGADVALKLFDTLTASGNFEGRLVDLADLGLLVDTSALRRLITKYLDLQRIQNSSRVVRVMTTNWKDGTLRMFSAEDLTPASAVEIILASSAIPAIFAPVAIEDTPYADGGLVMNSAMKPAIDAGAEEIHLVFVDPAIKDIPISSQAGTVEAVIRALTIALAATLNRDLDTARRLNLGLQLISQRRTSRPQPEEASKAAVSTLAGIGLHGPHGVPYRPITIHRYRPDEATPGAVRWLDFSRDQILRTIELGYLDTLRHNCVRQQCMIPAASSAPATTLMAVRPARL